MFALQCRVVGWGVSFLKQAIVNYLVVRAKEVEDIFGYHNLVNPFNLKKSIKQVMKDYNISNENELYHNLSLELSSAFYNISDKNSIYFSTINRKVTIMKIRIIYEVSNSGKSKGYRIIGLYDGINHIFCHGATYGIDNPERLNIFNKFGFLTLMQIF